MAHHNAINKTRWLNAQKRELEYWHDHALMEERLAYVERWYSPVIQRYAASLPEDAHILDMGCGPICPARLIETGEKTYVDPMLDDFRRMYPGKLPKGEHLSVSTEAIPKPDACFDLVLCLDALDHVLNPELTLNEVERLLKPSGVLMVGIMVCPALVAKLKYLWELWLPKKNRHPYTYAQRGISHTLARHFRIVEQHQLPDSGNFIMKEVVFICTHKEGSINHDA